MIDTFNMKITFSDGSTREHSKLSRVAVYRYHQHYIEELYATNIIITQYVK